MNVNSCDAVMWTAQTKAVLDVIERDGISYVKKDYIRQKYGESAWIFQTAYEFLIKRMRECVEKPQEAQSPVWLFADSKWAAAGQGTELVKVRIPAGWMLYFDRRRWNQILNLSYVGTREERTAFEQEMYRQGISDGTEVFTGSHYPLMKSRILKSWDGVFETEGLAEQDLQGAVWCLKREWVI